MVAQVHQDPPVTVDNVDQLVYQEHQDYLDSQESKVMKVSMDLLDKQEIKVAEEKVAELVNVVSPANVDHQEILDLLVLTAKMEIEDNQVKMVFPDLQDNLDHVEFQEAKA